MKVKPASQEESRTSELCSFSKLRSHLRSCVSDNNFFPANFVGTRFKNWRENAVQLRSRSVLAIVTRGGIYDRIFVVHETLLRMLQLSEESSWKN